MILEDRNLFARMNKGPRFLLLGQGQGEYTLAAPPISSTWFFPKELRTAGATSMAEDPRRNLELYDQLTHQLTSPPHFEQVTSIPWNTVFTTRIDDTLSTWLEADWRRVVPTASSNTRSSRSTTELQVRYLFGGLGLPDDERPPTDMIEWADWQRNAFESLDPKLITPKGIVFVEDWSPYDWLSDQDLYNFANRLGPGQVHLFSATADTTENPFIATAISRRLITSHSEPLSEFLRAARQSGFLQDFTNNTAEGSRLIPVGHTFVPINVATWNRIIGTARPVDLEILEPFAPAPATLTYQRFRTFLGASEGALPWKAIAAGMKLPRTYEKQLLKAVEAALNESDDIAPIILQGQTATGKSLALAWLAQMLARSGKAAVLHQARRHDRPSASEIEAYNLWVEGTTGLKTVLIWDGMVNTDEYFALHRQLRARGQRVLIVGSTYLNRSGNRDHFITAPIHLDKDEVDAYTPWLKSYGINLPALNTEPDTSILAMLYRAIPETEAGLRRGLTLEMRAAETGMEALSREHKQQEPKARMTAIAAALEAAGFDINTLAPAEHSPEVLPTLLIAERSTTEQLSAILLTAGRHNLTMPLELPLRIIGPQGSQAIIDFIHHFDIFRWTEDASGNQFLGVRTRLEAELLSRENLTDEAEIDIVSTLIRNIQTQFGKQSGGEEVNFIVQLMEHIGPQSQEHGRYRRWYGELADAFADQRTQTGESHPRLVLLEVNLMREFIKWSQRDRENTRERRLACLRNSEYLLQRTLEEDDNIAPRTRLNLYVELASSLGSQIYELVAQDNPSPAGLIEPILSQLLDTVMRARAIDPENIYPVDVLAWVAKDTVPSGLLTPQVRFKLLADARASLDSIDPDDLSPGQRSKYTDRQAEIARLLGETDQEQSFVDQLKSIDDPSATYLLARRALDKRNNHETIKSALSILLEAPTNIRDDWKCARLILDLYWQDKTGKYPLRGERNTIAFKQEDWKECLDLLDSLRGAATFDQYRISFLRGLALFHMGFINRCQTEFRELGSLGLDVSRRVHLTYLASNSNDNPTKYTGRVAWASADGRKGKVWVDQLRAEIDFVPLHFSSEHYRSNGEILPEFHIGFNYRGPIADPIRPRSAARKQS